MKNNLWGTRTKDNREIYVVLFVSRNKDNKNVCGFKERRESFLTKEEKDSDKLLTRFLHFVKDGRPGEMSRMYYSVNSRDEDKIHKELIHFLIDNPDFNICSINGKLAGIAAGSSCAKSAHWMFDFDINDWNKVVEFVNDIVTIDDTTKPYTSNTPHGYAVVVEHSFDTRELLKKWNENVTLKRDDMLCYSWRTKEAYEKE